MPIAKPAPAAQLRSAPTAVSPPPDAPSDAGSGLLGLVVSATAVAGTGLVLATLFGAIRQVVVGKTLGPAGLGVIGLAESVENLLIRVAPLGLTASVPLLVAKQLGRGEPVEAGRVLGTAMRIGVVLALVAAGLTALAAFGLAAVAPGAATLPTLLAWSLVVLGLTACQVSAAALRGVLAIPQATAVRDVLPNLLVLVLVAVGLLAGARLPLIAAFYAGGALAAAAIGLLLVGRAAADRRLRTTWDPALVRPLLALSVPILLMAASGQLIRQVNVPVLAAATDLATVGLFSTALFFATSVEAVFVALTLVYMPLASRALAADGRDSVAALQPAVGRWTLLATLVPVLVLVVAAEPAVELLFGPAFRGAEVAIRIVCAGLLVQAIVGPRNSVLLALDRARDVTVTFVAALAVVVLTSVVLIPVAGLAGAAVSFAAGTAVRSVLSLAFLARTLPATAPRPGELAALAVAPLVAVGPLLADGTAGVALSVLAAAALVALLFGRGDDVDRQLVRAALRRARIRR